MFATKTENSKLYEFHKRRKMRLQELFLASPLDSSDCNEYFPIVYLNPTIWAQRLKMVDTRRAAARANEHTENNTPAEGSTTSPAKGATKKKRGRSVTVPDASPGDDDTADGPLEGENPRSIRHVRNDSTEPQQTARSRQANTRANEATAHAVRWMMRKGARGGKEGGERGTRGKGLWMSGRDDGELGLLGMGR